MSDDWAVTTVGAVAEQVRRPTKVVKGVSYPLLGVRWYGEGPFVREIGVGGDMKATRVFAAQPGDFIYNRLFAWKGSFGVIAHELDGCFVSGEFPLFITDPDRLIPEYLNHLMCRPSTWVQIGHESTGSTTTSRNRWKEERFLEWPLRLPPVNQQLRVVDLISAIDESRSRARELSNASMAAALAETDAVTSRLVDAPTVELGRISEVVGGLTKDSKNEQPDYVDVPYLRVANVQRGYLDLEEVSWIRAPQAKVTKLSLKAGDVLFNEGGDRDKLGRGWVWESQLPECIHQNHVFRARMHGSDFDPYYVSIWGNSRFGRRWFEEMGSQTTNLASINMRTLRAFPVPAISRDEQREIVEIYLAFRGVANAAATEASALDAARSCLLGDLTAGHHRIPDAYDELLELAS